MAVDDAAFVSTEARACLWSVGLESTYWELVTLIFQRIHSATWHMHTRTRATT
jgi:hypothetical protein